MKRTVFALFVLFTVAAVSHGAVILDVDFDAYAFDTIAELEAAGLTFAGVEGTQYNIRWQNGEKTLYLDGEPGFDNKPSASIGGLGNLASGSSSFRWSHTASYSNSELRFLDNGTTVFSVGLTDDTKIRFYGANTIEYVIADNTNDPTTVNLSWENGSFSYDAGVDADGNPVVGTLPFLAAGNVDGIKYILNKNDNSSRESFLYEISVSDTVPEPATIILLALGSVAGLRRRK